MQVLKKKYKISILLIIAIMFSFTSGVGMAQPQLLDEGQQTSASQDNDSRDSQATAQESSQTENSQTENNLRENNQTESSQTDGKASEEKLLTLQEAIKMAEQNNPEILSVAQDINMRKQDVEKAQYYRKQLKDVEKAAKNAEEMLDRINQQLSLIPDPTNPTYISLLQLKQMIETKLEAAEPYRINTYENGKIVDLYETQAKIGLELTTIGHKVAVQKISLLVSKQYFDAVKYQKLAEVKKAAMDRAIAQENAAKASYDAGFRAKDDYLLAKAQSDLMKADYENAQMNLNNALVELKATIGMDQGTPIRLSSWDEEKLTPDLQKGLEQGLKKRLEIQKAEGELEIAALNFKIAGEYLGPGAVDYEQAKINVAKAEIELKKQKTNVEKDIRQAYQQVVTTNKMSQGVNDTVSSARESAAIAEYRYKEGFGIPSAIMKALNAEDLAGTMIEVLAAEEKLLEVEEKVIEIQYSSNLAKVNYLVSIGEGL